MGSLPVFGAIWVAQGGLGLGGRAVSPLEPAHDDCPDEHEHHQPSRYQEYLVGGPHVLAVVLHHPLIGLILQTLILQFAHKIRQLTLEHDDVALVPPILTLKTFDFVDERGDEVALLRRLAKGLELILAHWDLLVVFPLILRLVRGLQDLLLVVDRLVAWALGSVLLACDFGQGVGEQPTPPDHDLRQSEVTPFPVGGDDRDLDIAHDLALSEELLLSELVGRSEGAQPHPFLILQCELALYFELFGDP